MAVGLAPALDEALLPLEPDPELPVAAASLVAAATLMPYSVVVTTFALPLVVSVVVTTEEAVVVALQPDQVVQGAAVPHGPDVQPIFTVSITAKQVFRGMKRAYRSKC